MKPTSSTLTAARLADCCNRRLAPIFAPDELRTLRDYLQHLLERNEYPPYRGSRLDLFSLSAMLFLNLDHLKQHRHSLQPVFDALSRTVAERGLRPNKAPAEKPESVALLHPHQGQQHPGAQSNAASSKQRKRSGRLPRPIVEFPEPLHATWNEPGTFGEALQLHARRHGETIYHLYNAVVLPADGVNRSTLINWGRGKKIPRAANSLEILGRIERRYRLPTGYFAKMAGPSDRAPGDYDLP